MARGNFRSSATHGVAEVGSARKIIDGWVMRKSGSFLTKGEAHLSALRLRRNGYLARVVKGKAKFNVWRTFHRISNQVRTT
jgi:hypothetical protein